MIDLKPFCSTDEERPYLHQPWSLEKYTYATNGHIIVRVARRPDVPENLRAPNNVSGLFAAFNKNEFRSLRIVALPVVEEVFCAHCHGRGRECVVCKGTGISSSPLHASVKIGNAFAAVIYARMLSELPGIEVSVETHDRPDPIPFRFDGGDGLLMGRSCAADKHFYIVL